MQFEHKHDTLWLAFGVFHGGTINYISNFTKIKFMVLIVLKAYLKTGEMVLKKDVSI